MSPSLTLSLGDFTELPLLLPQLTADHREMAIDELSHRLAGMGCIEDANLFTDVVLKHDDFAPTVFDGVAFPLGRHATVRRLSFAAGFAKRPIHWCKDQHVQTVILIALPESDGTQYLSLIPVFSNFLKDPAGLAAMRHCVTAEEMLHRLGRFNL